MYDPPTVIVGQELVSPQAFPDVYQLVSRYAPRVPSPAAGADISIPVPNGLYWDVNSLTALFTASAAAASRLVGFVIKNQDGQVTYKYQTTTALTANQTCTFTFSEDFAAAMQAPSNGGFILGPAPKAYLPPGWTFGTVTAAIDAADQWSLVTPWIEELLPPPGE